MNLSKSTAEVRPFALSGNLLTTAQAAEFLSMSQRTLEDWRLRGGGPRFRKLGRSVRYAPVDLQDFLDRAVYSNTGEAGQLRAA
ncbi:helix-turn-helix domain-containing protein [Caulobacter endophyticus]|uniref:helix-turn-helix domain-containing protein n=1 Tax=Caulobacter endophyticus TaxID=2172652 RepID=UPI00240FD287|nr:helix-turn-helix domain-containing protein [Caulobacter endophyticus]MDG2531031.1 helix-turn-helix domain-containing protein [Caulobacter endophyticus]